MARMSFPFSTLRAVVQCLLLVLAAACTQHATPTPPPTAAQTTVIPGSYGTSASNTTQTGEGTCPLPAPGTQPECESKETESVILAGGCFWGMEDILHKIPGVISTEVGYAGGTEGVDYQAVHTGNTGNAEAVRIVFAPRTLPLDQLLEHWFFRMHDPTTPNRQGNDVGSQYRSAIFVTSPTQLRTAELVKQRVDLSGNWKKPVVTQILKAGTFTRAEEHHQHYLEKNPGGYTCHYLRDFSHTDL